MDDEDALPRPIGWWLRAAHTRLDAAFEDALAGTGVDRREWQVSATPMSVAAFSMTSWAGVRQGFSVTPSIRAARSLAGATRPASR